MTLAFMDATGFSEQHFAFLVAEGDFDAIVERIQASGAGFYADPFRQRPAGI